MSYPDYGPSEFTVRLYKKSVLYIPCFGGHLIYFLSLFHQGSLHSNDYFNNVAPSSATTMTFGDYPVFFAPPIQGELTSLLLQADGHK
jgi:hypothetical protein